MNERGSKSAKDQASKTERLRPDAAGLARAAALLGAGQLVAFPTETVYGLGADATDAKAVAAIYAAKERPSFNPLIAHVADLAAAQREGLFDANALALAQAFWPGPLTLVVGVAPTCRICELARAGLATVALRIPRHPVARGLLSRIGKPVAAPSANRSGRLSATSAGHALDDLDGRIAAVLDGGGTELGIESTIVECHDGQVQLLRPGGITREAIEKTIGTPLSATTERPRTPAAPGMLASHYAPRAPLRINAGTIAPGEAALLFGRNRPQGLEKARKVLNLSETGDLVEAAANLFGHLRMLDSASPAAIAVVSIPRRGLGEAINDRLSRGAMRK